MAQRIFSFSGLVIILLLILDVLLLINIEGHALLSAFLVFMLVVLVCYGIAYLLLHDDGMNTDAPDLHDRVYVVTGTTHGLGREAARRFARHGATLVMLNRDKEGGAATAAAISAESGNEHVYNVWCDLGSLASVKAASEEVLSKWPVIDVLLCNAGVLTDISQPTSDGFEKHYGVNFLSHFVLINNLLPALQQSPQARLVLMSSVGQWMTTGLDLDHLTFDEVQKDPMANFMTAYCRSKLAMLIVAKECQRRYGSDKLISVAAAPGVVFTSLWRDSSFLTPLLNTVLFVILIFSHMFIVCFMHVFVCQQTTSDQDNRAGCTV